MRLIKKCKKTKTKIALLLCLVCLYARVVNARGPKVYKRILEDIKDKQNLVKKVAFI
jgi:hypothetical protein